MPTVFWVAGYRVMIRTNDHPPTHVHVLGSEGRAKIRLDCEQGGIELMWHDGIRRSDLRLVLAEVEARIARLCDEWRRIHGQD